MNSTLNETERNTLRALKLNEKLRECENFFLLLCGMAVAVYFSSLFNLISKNRESVPTGTSTD